MRSEPRQDEIAFEDVDAEIFRIPDDKTRLNTLQNYFFPRLDRLVRFLVEQVREVYEIDPYEDMTLTYRPAHRKDAAKVRDSGEVYVGLTPKKTDQPLCVFHEDGTPYKYSPCSLVANVDPRGALQVSFRPFMYKVDDAYRRRFRTVVEASWEQLGPVMEWNRIAPAHVELWTPLRNSLSANYCRWTAPPLHFPVSESHWLSLTVSPFLALYPLLDTGARLARGHEPRLHELIERLRSVLETSVDELEAGEDGEDAGGEVREEQPAIALPELDSYRMVRTGIWFQVLARDKFTCCACGRSGPKHGIVLHVDHIVPRSKGGTDDIKNLQALCLKCNIGKSNKDDTRLTLA